MTVLDNQNGGNLQVHLIYVRWIHIHNTTFIHRTLLYQTSPTCHRTFFHQTSLHLTHLPQNKNLRHTSFNRPSFYKMPHHQTSLHQTSFGKMSLPPHALQLNVLSSNFLPSNVRHYFLSAKPETARNPYAELDKEIYILVRPLLVLSATFDFLIFLRVSL